MKNEKNCQIFYSIVYSHNTDDSFPLISNYDKAKFTIYSPDKNPCLLFNLH